MKRVYLKSFIIGSHKYYRVVDGDLYLTELLWSVKAIKRAVRQHNKEHIEQWNLIK